MKRNWIGISCAPHTKSKIFSSNLSGYHDTTTTSVFRRWGNFFPFRSSLISSLLSLVRFNRARHPLISFELPYNLQFHCVALSFPKQLTLCYFLNRWLAVSTLVFLSSALCWESTQLRKNCFDYGIFMMSKLRRVLRFTASNKHDWHRRSRCRSSEKYLHKSCFAIFAIFP